MISNLWKRGFFFAKFLPRRMIFDSTPTKSIETNLPTSDIRSAVSAKKPRTHQKSCYNDEFYSKIFVYQKSEPKNTEGYSNIFWTRPTIEAS